MAVREEELLSIKRRFGIIGNSPSLNHAIEVAVQVAPTDMTVLITGESGVGKESFSKIIHQLSKRKHGQFIAINCGAIPEGTIDSELFGHEKGSFTGAYDARKGYFEVTNGGTIFLDEIAEMPLGTQARLLRVLEYGEFIRVGSSKSQKTDVRVVAASNVNLSLAVEKGKFRQDLYYRLSTVPISVPPLRDRGEDIVLLFRKFAADFSEKYRVKPISLTSGASDILMQFRFPGNIRQLKNLAEQISVIEMERELSTETIAKYLPRESTVPMLYSMAGKGNEGFSERELLYKVLFDMKKDMVELKKLVHQALESGDFDSHVLKEHQDFFKGIDNDDQLGHKTPDTSALTIAPKDDNETFELDKYEDLTSMEEESLSLEVKEKELIIKALKKNNNKRKYAARELGISERTLYRKIKQYGVEE